MYSKGSNNILFHLIPQVYLGSGHWIDRNAWDKGLKVRTKDSLFCNYLPQAVWGKKVMKSRSLSGRPGHNAKAKDKATLRKVKLCEGTNTDLKLLHLSISQVQVC